MKKVEFTEKEIEYIETMINCFKDSLNDICDDNRKVLVNYVSQEEADEEFSLIDSITQKIGE